MIAPRKLLGWTAALVMAFGCSEDSDVSDPSKSGSLNVSMGGAQDFALFRSLVEQGEVPAPGTLDAVGFLAEHAMDLPPADCGNDVCVHPMLAVAPRFDGGSWQMAFVAMNTPVDASTLERPSLHLVVVVEPSLEVMPVLMDAGFASLFAGLRSGDHVSLVLGYEAAREVLLAAEPDAEFADLALADQSIDVDYSLYEGLAGARRALRATPRGSAARILLVTSGRAGVGVADGDRIVAAGAALARNGVGLGVVGVGEAYEPRIPAQLGTLGAGSYSYAPDAASLGEALALEGETTLFPLATNFHVRIDPSPGYSTGRLFGMKRARVLGGGVDVDLPALFIGRREGAQDVGGGRRGGGGGLFVELRVDPGAAVSIDAGKAAFHIQADWTEASGPKTYELEVTNPLRPGVPPEGVFPYFSEADYGKPFMTLNMFLALSGAVLYYDGGDCARALGVIDMMATGVDYWQGSYNDPDIAADWVLMQSLGGNIIAHCGALDPIRPVNDDNLGCFGI
jgi:Ca-activated chloride channel homolog